MNATQVNRLKQIEQALKLMPKIAKRQETQFVEELKFANKIFGRTVKEIFKFSAQK